MSVVSKKRNTELKNALVEINKEFSKAAEVNISSSDGPETWLGGEVGGGGVNAVEEMKEGVYGRKVGI